MEDLLISASLRRLRTFLAVCQTMHMARAAELLGVAQPALSQQIKSLEDSVGVKLFNRRKRGIDLTAAGEAFRKEAQALIDRHRAAIDGARQVARGELGTLAIGYVTSAMFHDAFPALIGTLREQVPGLTIKLQEGGIEDLIGALDQGTIEIALVRAPAPLKPGFERQVAVRQKLVAVLHETHRFATRATVSLAELADEPMITFNDSSDTGILGVVLNLASAGQKAMTIAWRVSTMTSVLGLVSAKCGYGIVPDDLSKVQLPGIRFVPIKDRQAVAELWYIWNSERVNPSIRWLLDRARLTAEQ